MNVVYTVFHKQNDDVSKTCRNVNTLLLTRRKMPKVQGSEPGLLPEHDDAQPSKPTLRFNP